MFNTDDTNSNVWLIVLIRLAHEASQREHVGYGRPAIADHTVVVGKCSSWASRDSAEQVLAMVVVHLTRSRGLILTV